MRETTGIAYMHNACRFWQIGNDYPFTKSKEMGEVVGSLPPHNDNTPFRRGEWHISVTGIVINPKNRYTDLNNHIKMTAPLPICSV